MQINYAPFITKICDYAFILRQTLKLEYRQSSPASECGGKPFATNMRVKNNE